MEESNSSDSDREEKTHDTEKQGAVKIESDGSYSDSDQDETKEPMSMLHVYKTGHVPGKYKQNLQMEAVKHSEELTNVGHLDNVIDNEKEATEAKNDIQDDSSSKTENENLQELKQSEARDDNPTFEKESDFAETGIFGKSMLVIPKISFDENTVKSDNDLPSSKKQPPPVPSKPSLDISMRYPDTPPKPKPRKSKLSRIVPTEEKSPINEKNSPVPSPRPKRKSDDVEQSLTTENQPPESDSNKPEEMVDVLSEVKPQEIILELKEDYESDSDNAMIQSEEEKVTDDEVNTVDIGSVNDIVTNNLFDDHLSEKKGIDTESNAEQYLAEELILDQDKEKKNEQTDLQQSVALSSFEVIETKDNSQSEESDTDSEVIPKFVNDFQNPESGKDNLPAKQLTSDSESEEEFQTPDNHSEDERESDVFYDSKLSQPVNIEQDLAEVTKNNDKDKVEEEPVDKAPGSDATPGTENVETKIKAFEESVVVLGKGTLKETGYESLSSTVSSGELRAVTLPKDMTNSDENEKSTPSISARISMFESFKTEDSKNDQRKSSTNNSSFELLSNDVNSDMELKPEMLPKCHKDKYDLDAMKKTDEEIATETLSSSVQDVSCSHQEENEESEGDVMQDQVPPPVPSKSEQVYESLRSLVVEQDVPFKQPQSLGAEIEGKTNFHLLAKDEKDDVNISQIKEDSEQNQRPASEHVLEESFTSSVSEYAPSGFSMVDVKGNEEEVVEECNTNEYEHAMNTWSGSEQASSSQERYVPSPQDSTEEQQDENTSWQHSGQFQQTPQSAEFQYMPYGPQQQQQQQQGTPMWNQQYYYDESGNAQFMNPYAFFNPNMNPGLFYQNPSMPYYQQPYFSNQNTGYSFGQTPQREGPYGYQTPTQPTDNFDEKVQQSESFPDKDNISEIPHRQESGKDLDHGHQTQIGNDDIVESGEHKNESETPLKQGQGRHSAKKNRHSKSHEDLTGTAEYPKLAKSKSEEQIKKSKVKNSSSVKRSMSEPSKTPHGKLLVKNRQTKEKLRRRLHEDVPEEQEEVGKVEEYYIYFKGINPSTKRENLANFVELTTRGDVDPEKIIFNYSRTCALITVSLDKKLDMHSIKERIKSRGIESSKPEVYEVPPPTSIAVSCETDIRSTESLSLYFESKKAGVFPDAEAKGEPYESEDCSCIVIEFGDAEVVKKLCARRHVWEEKTLRVSPYYKCKAGEIWNSDLHVLKLPDPFVVELQHTYLHFLQRKCCEELHVSLRENNCIVRFTEKGIELECTLTPTTPGFKDLAKHWEETTRKTVEKYIMDNIIEEALHSTEPVWNELIEFFKSENIKAREDVLATLNDSDYVILLIGFNNPVKEISKNIKGKQAEIEKRLNRRTENVSCDALKLELLSTIGFFDDLKQTMNDIEVFVGDGEVTIEGQPEDITAVRVKMYAMDDKISEDIIWSHGLSNECIDFVERKLINKITSLMRDKGITAVWKIDRTDVMVRAYEVSEESSLEENDYENIGDVRNVVGKKAKEFLESAVVEMQEDIQDSIVEVLTSSEWYSFLENITETYETAAEIERKDSVGKLLVYGMKKEADEIYKQMKDFIEENAVRMETIKSGSINVKFIEKHKKDIVDGLERKLEDCKIKIELQDDSINIRGNRRGIAEARKEFKNFFDSILCEKYTIQKVAVQEVFRDEAEQGTINTVEKETRCLIKLPGENATFVEQASIAGQSDDSDEDYLEPVTSRNFGATAEPRSKGFNVPTQGFKAPNQGFKAPNQGFKAPNGIKITLVKGELGQQDGNVIVVTTSPNLNLSSGNACKSVLRAGGPALQEQCKTKYPNDIKLGEIAVVDGGGSLECNKVYLTTLPNWNSDHEPKQVLEKVMKDSLELASKYQMYSIIFSAMGTGQLRYPTDLVAMLMYQGVIDFDKNNPQSTVKEVSFVLYQKDYPTIKAFEEEERLRLDGGGERPVFDLKTGNMTIELLVENIAQQRVDGILCATSQNMDLSRNGACQALLRAGGPSLQEECKTKHNSKLEEGTVAEIGGGKLSCKSVFLTLLPSYNEDAIGILKKVIETLLQLAQAKGLSSLALPALGTGFLRYPKDEVCKCMFETVIDFAQKNPNSSIKTVRFIMYAKDHGVIQRFKSYIQNARGRGRRESRQFTMEPKRSSARPKTVLLPQKKTSCNMHPDGVQVGRIKLNVFKDNILSQKTDAIVSSVGNDFQFIGAVAHELKTKCPKMAAECQKRDKKHKLQTKGLVMTKASELPAKNVIHVKFAESLDEWQNRFRKCLEKANKKSLKTISFPVLGTGKGFKTFHPEAIAGCFFDAIYEFEKAAKSLSISEIRLIVYQGQPAMFKPILEKLHKKVQEAIAAESSGTSSWKKYASKQMTRFKRKAADWITGKEEGVISQQEFKQFFHKNSSMEIQIYSDNKDNIERCKKELDARLEKLYTKTKIENYKEIVKSLSQEEAKLLDVIALANINIDPQTGVVTIEGPTQNVSDARHELQMALLKIERKRLDKKGAEELSKLVQWQYEEVTPTEFKLTPYNEALNQMIEHAYKANKSKFEFEDDDGDRFVIDFKQLIEYKKSDDQDRLRVLRKDILKSVTSALPEEWADMKDNENIKVVALTATDQTYKDIENRFTTEVKTGSYTHRLNFNPNNLQVNKIERIQNKALYRQYQAKKTQMTEQKPNLPATMPIERDLWHATKFDAVTSIQMHGFNRSYSGNANGEPWYGEGVYFAGDASYSARGWLSGAGAGSKGYMFLVKTLSGQLCQGKKGMRYLPPVDPKDSTVIYDCAVDKLQNPLEFVIFNDTQAYPAYIITFTT